MIKPSLLFCSPFVLLALGAAGCGGMSDTDLSDQNDKPLSKSKDADDAKASEGSEKAPSEDAPEDRGQGTSSSSEQTQEGSDLGRGSTPTEPEEPSTEADEQDVAQAMPASETAQRDPDAEPEEQPEELLSDNEPEQASPAQPEEETPVSWLAGVDEDAELEVVDDLSVLVIFDNSGSMDAYWDGNSRWDVANRALYDAIAPVRTSLTVGAIRFPFGAECDVPDFEDGEQFGFSLADDFLDDWAERSVLPAGGTPLGPAFVAADAAIAEAGERDLLNERFNVIVLTDGEPNCDTDPALLTQLPAKWLERGVKTHVLGLPGSTAAATLLNDIAEAGGTVHFQQLGTPEELEEDLVAATR